VCDRCNPGFFQDQTGETDCPSCPAGFFCEDRATVAPVPCRLSEYCPEGSSTNATCPLGFFCENADVKMPCAAGIDFCPTGSVAQTPCPANSVCAFDVDCSEDGLGATVWLNEADGSSSFPFLCSPPPHLSLYLLLTTVFPFVVLRHQPLFR
jgi:hypothetical protein